MYANFMILIDYILVVIPPKVRITSRILIKTHGFNYGNTCGRSTAVFPTTM